MPLILIGSFVLMVLNLPIASFQNFMIACFGEDWKEIGLSIYKGTFQVMAIIALISVSYAYANEQDVVRSGEISPIIIILSSFASYICFVKGTDTVTDFAGFDSAGMFGAIIIAVVSTKLFIFFYTHSPRRLKLLPNDSDAILVLSMRTALPALFTIFVFGFAKIMLDSSGLNGVVQTGYDSMGDALMHGGRSLLTVTLFNLITHILWFFGLHGTNILDGVAKDLFVSASDANIALHEAGLPATEILTKEYFDAFVYMGGAGATLGLLIALMIGGKSSNVDRLAKFSFIPGFFNINEMMIYGLPIIFNPYYLLPFLLTPVVLSITTLTAMSAGFVPLTIARVEWTTPIFISGYVSTGSFSGVILQLVNLVISVLIYLPFTRLYERNQSRNNLRVFQTLGEEIRYVQEVERKTIINRTDDVGILARALATEIENALGGVGTSLHLVYQPKVNAGGKIIGAETLLRWSHPYYGFVSPPVIVGLAEEADLANRLGTWIMENSLEALKKWRDAGFTDISMSINLSPKQLRDDANLTGTVQRLLSRFDLPASLVELELTENMAIDQSAATRGKLEQLKALGVNISIDDFGMGHSSLLYLRDFYANVVKIDMSLVRHIDTELQSQEIVKSVVSLCSQLHVEIIAEGVETKEEMEKLRELGCMYYQGYYYSKPLSYDDFVMYAEEHGCAVME